ncbi:MarR family winged helix-turn-helix transcriptional regulator [Dactylosporangium sp. CA-233914]|uniref:MarR family winged helix-turn-helix transcriptional regulator n=1 Tax=Dactylosporangium sp. CA-233914 TaxID=3239934 RepID=UPI003D947F0A
MPLPVVSECGVFGLHTASAYHSQRGPALNTNDDRMKVAHSPDTARSVLHDGLPQSLMTAVAEATSPQLPARRRRPGAEAAADPALPSHGPSSPDLVSALDLVAQRFKGAVLAEVLAPNGLTWSEFQVLRMVAGNPEIRSVDAANRVGMSRGTLSEVVGRLTRRGAVARLEVLQSGRQVLLQLTDDGAHLWRSIAPQVVETEHRFIGLAGGRRLLEALVHRITIELDRP